MFNNNDNEIRDLRIRVARLESELKSLKDSFYIPVGKCDGDGFYPVEIHDAKSTKIRFDLIFKHLGVKSERVPESIQLIKIKPTKL